MNKRSGSSQHAQPGAKRADIKDNLWYRHELDDVYFQRETFVTYMSILGGVAVGALLTQFLPLVEQVMLSRWYLILYFLSSLLNLISSWVVVAWAAITLKMQIRFWLVIPQFFMLFTQCINCLLVTNPSGWMATADLFLFIILANNIILKKNGMWNRYSTQEEKAAKQMQVVYLALMTLAFGASLHLYFYPSAIIETIWGVVALLGSILALVKQHSVIEGERKAFGIP